MVTIELIVVEDSAIKLRSRDVPNLTQLDLVNPSHTTCGTGTRRAPVHCFHKTH